MTPRRAPRGRSSRRGRGWVAVGLGLLVFLLVASAVVWRRSRGIAMARELRVLAQRRAQLVAERAALQSEVRIATSRARIGPVAEQRLGMRVPADTQVVFVARPSAPAPAASKPR
jgi:cell division protein FtsL